MRRRQGARTRASGFTVVEAAIVAAVVSVALCGMVASVNTARQLERRTQQLSRASASVSGQMEQIRIEAAGRWSSLGATYDGTEIKVAESTSSSDSTLRTTVASTTSGLTDPTGMWATGATQPNFYFVDVSADVTGTGMSALRFQTYIADRERTVAPAGAPPGSTPPTTPPDGFATQGEQISATPVSVTTSGTDGVDLTAELRNDGSTAVELTRVVVSVKNGGEIQSVAIDGTNLYAGTKKNVRSIDTGSLTTPLSIGAGTFEFQVNDIVPLTKNTDPVDRVVTLTMTFSDGSSRTVDVQP